jgi:O-antigen/teichoic acid export membrane protein
VTDGSTETRPGVLSRLVAVLIRFRTILSTTSSVVGTTLVNSGLGFVYWWAAVRVFSPESSGLAVAAISAMSLLGRLAVLGVGTALVGVLPAYAGNKGGLVLAAFLVSSAASVIIGVAFALGAPFLFPTFSPLAAGLFGVGLFTAGCLLTTIGTVFDTILIGVLRGSLQLLRNVIFATVKLALVFVAVAWFGDTESSLFATWMTGDLVSLLVVGAIFVRRDRIRSIPRPEWRYIFGLGRNAVGHHVLNLARLAPTLITPILVAGILSPEANAEFYVTLLLAGSLQIFAAAATFTLYAVAGQSLDKLHHQVRFTLGLSMSGVTGSFLVLLLVADLLLGLFGWEHSAEDRLLLVLIGLQAYPLIIKDHWIALRRFQQDVRWAAWVVTAGAAMEIVLAAVGAIAGGVIGLAAAWLAAVAIQAALMARFVYGETGFPRLGTLIRSGPIR